MTHGRGIFLAAALSALLALVHAAGALASPPVGVEDNFFAPRSTTISLQQSVIWVWDLDGSGGGTTAEPHNVVSKDGLFSSDLIDTGSYEVRPSAGRYGYFCVLHFGMTGKLRVRPNVSEPADARPFRVAWAGPTTRTGDRYDVRFKAAGGRWETWLEDTRAGSGRFGRKGDPVEVEAGATYRFQARSQQGAGEGKRSAWSPTVKART